MARLTHGRRGLTSVSVVRQAVREPMQPAPAMKGYDVDTSADWSAGFGGKGQLEGISEGGRTGVPGWPLYGCVNVRADQLPYPQPRDGPSGVAAICRSGDRQARRTRRPGDRDRKSTRLNSSH